MKKEKIVNLVNRNIGSAKKKYAKSDTIKYIDISSIDNIKNKLTGFTEYVFEKAPSRAQQCLIQNDILVSTVRPNLRNIAINDYKDDNYVGSSGFCVLRTNEKCDSHYLYYNLLYNEFTNAMISLTAGAAYPAIKDSDILNYEINVPPLPEQQKIAHQLDTIQSAIDNKKQQLSQLDELVKSKFVEMFGDENSIHNWNCVKVEDVAKVSVGIVVKPTQYYTNSGIKAFRSLNIGELHINDSDWVYLTKEGNEKNKKSIIHKDDVLVVRTGNPGISCVVPEEYDGCNAIDIIIARPNKKIINSVYLSAFTSFPHGMIQIFDNMTGVAQKHFNVGRYQSMDIALPPIELQNTFAQYVQKIDAAKSIIKTQLVDLQELLDSKMDEYFGE